MFSFRLFSGVAGALLHRSKVDALSITIVSNLGGLGVKKMNGNMTDVLFAYIIRVSRVRWHGHVAPLKCYAAMLHVLRTATRVECDCSGKSVRLVRAWGVFDNIHCRKLEAYDEASLRPKLFCERVKNIKVFGPNEKVRVVRERVNDLYSEFGCC